MRMAGIRRIETRSCRHGAPAKALCYDYDMTSKALNEVLRRVEHWPESRQDEAARVLLEMEGQDASPLTLTEEQVAEVERRLAAPHRKFITLDEVRRRFDRQS